MLNRWIVDKYGAKKLQRLGKEIRGMQHCREGFLEEACHELHCKFLESPPLQLSWPQRVRTLDVQFPLKHECTWGAGRLVD